MDDQQGENRQGGEERSGEGQQVASKGINPVQHSERTASKGINPVQHSERQQDDDRGGGDKDNEKGNG